MKKLIRSFWLLTIAAVLGLALSLPPVFAAELPLRQILESSAGRLFFGEGWRGSELVRALVGAEVPTTESTSRLIATLERPGMARTAQRIQERLNRVGVRYAERSAGENAFGTTINWAAESQKLENLRAVFNEELGDEFFTRFRPLIENQALSANAQAFLMGGSTESHVAELMGILERWSRERVNLDAVVAFQTVDRLLAVGSDLHSLLPKEAMLELLTDQEMRTFVDHFYRVTEAIAADSSAATLGEKFKNAVRAMLQGKVPADTIAARVDALSGTADLATLRRAMGDMTLEETQRLIYGGDPLRPSPESLLGRYIAETGAATVVRTFPRGPLATDPQGPQRLVVALSQESFEKYLEFMTGENLFMQVHTPSQGTLHVAFKGRHGSYANLNAEMRFPSLGTLMPQVVLKSTEGQRLAQYFDLGSKLGGYAQQPWTLPVPAGVARPYCATGAYSSCTHWVGNMPIGDTLVSEYSFPGVIDRHAGNTDPRSPAPRVQMLGDYLATGPDADLLKRVWKPFSGNKQFADVIGLSQQNLGAELANPGWVLISMTGAAPVERVPFVFLIVQDHRAPIAPDFGLSVNAY